MKKYVFSIVSVSLFSLFVASNFFCQETRNHTTVKNSDSKIIELPEPKFKSTTSVEEALLERRSARDYSDEPLTISEISQILWAAQGITGERYNFRTAPSAGALYPLEIYVAVNNVKDLSPGLYKYKPQNHTVIKISDGDKRSDISNAALRQDAIENSSAIVLITAVYERTSVKYGGRAERYVHIEAGAVGQNIYLQSVPLKIGTVMIGAFKDEDLKTVLNLPADEQPLAIMPLGKI
jgi:SagB-type dehydrogenase family enzyme